MNYRRHENIDKTLRISSYVAAVILMTLSSPALATCNLMLKTGKIGPAELQGYQDAPETLLLSFPSGGYFMSRAVMQVAVISPGSIPALVGAAALASAKQQAAVGLGLRDAADSCLAQDPAMVQRIVSAVVAANAIALKRSFASDPDDSPDVAAAPANAARPSGTFSGPALPLENDIPDVDASHRLPDPFGPPSDWR